MTPSRIVTGTSTLLETLQLPWPDGGGHAARPLRGYAAASAATTQRVVPSRCMQRRKAPSALPTLATRSSERIGEVLAFIQALYYQRKPPANAAGPQRLGTGHLATHCAVAFDGARVHHARA